MYPRLILLHSAAISLLTSVRGSCRSLSDFLAEAAGRTLRTAGILVFQTFGEFGVWHPHWHSIVLEGGFDRHDCFLFIPVGASEALCQYIVRAPLSLQRIRWDEQQNAVTWSSSPSGYFKGKQRRYSSLDFIAQVTLHIPPRGRHLVRRYGLYSSRGRGTWKDRPALRSCAPDNWYGRKVSGDSALPDAPKDQEVGASSLRKTWARLLAKVHELDMMACPRCGSRLSVIAVIVDPAQILKIIACLERHGRGPLPLG